MMELKSYGLPQASEYQPPQQSEKSVPVIKK